MTIVPVTALTYTKLPRKWWLLPLKYPYQLDHDLIDDLAHGWAQTSRKYLFCTKTKKGGEIILGSLHRGRFTIFSAYRSDGATYAPDFRKIMRGVFFHDLMCQFAAVKNSPFTREEADLLFYDHMDLVNFRLKSAYFAGVRFGAEFLTTAPDPNLYIRIL